MSNQYNFLDPYEDLILSSIITPSEAIKLSKQEYKILLANIRSEIIFSKAIKEILIKKAKTVLKELKTAGTTAVFE